MSLIKTEEVILENAEYNSTEELEEELQLQLEDSGGESYSIQYQSEPSEITTPASQRRQHNMSASSGASGKNSTSGSANKNILESEKRIRREIANSNERRRMQSINAGFQNLRSLLPRHEGEKLSKAAILQQTSQYICELENQKTQLLAQNSQLKRQLGQHESSGSSTDAPNTNGTEVVALKKRKITDNVINIQTISDSSDEGLGSMSPEPMTLLTGNTKTGQVIIAHNNNAASNKELLEMKKQLEKERLVRNMLEDELQTIKRQLYSVATAPASATTTYIPREVIEHTDNLMREHLVDELPPGSVSYVEIDEVTGQQQVVVCSSIEELESESAAAADEIITEDMVHEEVILSSNSSTESEQEVNAIAKAYAAGGSPGSAEFQPILQAAMKATPKVEVEHINETIIRVKTEKIEQPGLTRSRQNLETIVEAIRHLEGDHLFADGTEAQKQQQQGCQKSQETPLALTNKAVQAAAAAAAAGVGTGQHSTRATIAELRPFLQLKGNKQITIVGGSLALSQQLNKCKTTTAIASTAAGSSSAANRSITDKDVTYSNNGSSNNTATPTAILKVQTCQSSNQTGQHVTITTSGLKQCRPGVIVAKKLS